jgi:hypothetical protein
MPESEPIAWRATSRMAFNQTGRTLHNPELFGVPQKPRRALGRNSAFLIVPRRATGCFHQRNRAIRSLAGRKVGHSLNGQSLRRRRWVSSRSGAPPVWGHESSKCACGPFSFRAANITTDASGSSMPRAIAVACALSGQSRRDKRPLPARFRPDLKPWRTTLGTRCDQDLPTWPATDGLGNCRADHRRRVRRPQQPVISCNKDLQHIKGGRTAGR